MDYQLRPIGKACSRSGKELRPGEVCYSALLTKGDEWVRLDFSSEGWEGPPEGAIGYWRCRVPIPEETRRRVVDPDELLRRFEQLCDDANPAQDAFRYVLALLLVQRRRLRITATRSQEGASILELTGASGEGPYEVRSLQLSDDEVRALQQALDEYLTQGGNESD
jgi:hypothetical protein